MALKIHVFTLPQPPRFWNHASLLPILTLTNRRPKIPILCSKNNLGDAELASNLAAEVAKIKTQLVQKEEAMKKSRGLLFAELCQFLSVGEEEVKVKWGKMNEEEKWVLTTEFVNEWGVNFHPLSARSVKEMVEEYLREEKPPSSNSSPSVFFPALKRIMGFSQNK
ncbi:hypothetical protein SLE2022_145310 [Rubroshorea leprosula]